MSSDEFNWDPKAFPKGDFEEDYYSVLEVNAGASFKEIKKSYYRIVFLYHPDRKESEKEKNICNKQMMVINAAYKVLKDEKLRAMYDKKRQKGLTGKKAVGKSTSTQPTSSSKQEPKSTTEDDIVSPFSGNSGTTSSRFKNFVESEGNKYKQQNAPNDYGGDDDDYTYDSNFNRVYKPRTRRQETQKSNEQQWESYFTAVGAPTFDDNSSLNSLKAKLEIMQNERDTKMSELAADDRDWGEVRSLLHFLFAF